MELLNGLLVFPNFLTPEQSSHFLSILLGLRFRHDFFRGRQMKRDSACFGWEYVAAGRQLLPAPEFPPWLTGLVEMALMVCPKGTTFDQCIVQRYPPGAGIDWHTDSVKFGGDCIVGASFGGDGKLGYRPVGSQKATARFTATHGSLYIMSGPARWDYQHKVWPVLGERFSVTLRSLRPSIVAPDAPVSDVPGLGLPPNILTADRSLRSSIIAPDAPVDDVPGFLLHQDILTADQGNDLVYRIEENSARWEVDYARRAQRYGYRYIYATRMLEPLGPLPEWLAAWARWIRDKGWMASMATQCTIQEYEPGAGINDHIDDLLCFGKDVVTFSLLSPCAYRLVLPKLGIKREFIIYPRSAVVLSGDARSVWKHGIPARKTDKLEGAVLRRTRRLSITFRTVNPSRIAD